MAWVIGFIAILWVVAFIYGWLKMTRCPCVGCMVADECKEVCTLWKWWEEEKNGN